MKSIPQSVSSELLGEGRFLRLETLTYTDRRGVERKWETASRQNNQGAVLMVPILRPSDRYVIIEQYRPPVSTHVIEFPAGLIDPGEPPEQTAVRELLEETGYAGSLTWMSRPTGSSAGMTGETVILALVEIDETLPENDIPAPQLEEGEDITTHLLPLDEVGEFFRQHEEQGAVIDSRTAAYFIGLGIRW